MKTLLAILAVVTGVAVMAPASTQAHESRSSSRGGFSSCDRCHIPLRRERVVVGRDRCGRPIFGWRTVSHACRPPQHHHHYGHSHR